jgi:N-acetylmuramoyl-L-alanine amidase
MDYSDGDPDIESDFAILKKTACPAVLTENGFQDCEESLQFLESNEGKEAIIGLHVDGILDFINPNREYGYKDLTRHRRQLKV